MKSNKLLVFRNIENVEGANDLSPYSLFDKRKKKRMGAGEKAEREMSGVWWGEVCGRQPSRTGGSVFEKKENE
jgi:hypothetical protein